jgi:hypothetical protein
LHCVAVMILWSPRSEPNSAEIILPTRTPHDARSNEFTRFEELESGGHYYGQKDKVLAAVTCRKWHSQMIKSVRPRLKETVALLMCTSTKQIDLQQNKYCPGRGQYRVVTLVSFKTIQCQVRGQYRVVSFSTKLEKLPTFLFTLANTTLGILAPGVSKQKGLSNFSNRDMTPPRRSYDPV